MSLFLYQMIHVAGRSPRHLSHHLEQLRGDAQRLYGRKMRLDERSIEAEIISRLDAENYPNDRSTTLRLELTPEGELRYRFVGDSLYRGYVLRVLRPVGHLRTFVIPWEGICSSAERAAWQLAGSTIPEGVVIRCNEQGEILEAEGAPLFALYGRTIYTTREPRGVYGELTRTAIQRAGYALRIEPVAVEHLPLLDELFYSDHRGITSLERYAGGKLLMTAVAKRIAEEMERLAR